MDSNRLSPAQILAAENLHIGTVPLAKYRKDFATLQAEIRTLQDDNSSLKSKLVDTENKLKVAQAELGKAVVANVMQVSFIPLVSVLFDYNLSLDKL